MPSYALYSPFGSTIGLAAVLQAILWHSLFVRSPDHQLLQLLDGRIVIVAQCNSIVSQRF
eukprot:2745724-Karenia_brevis.AAC.1